MYSDKRGYLVWKRNGVDASPDPAELTARTWTEEKCFVTRPVITRGDAVVPDERVTHVVPLLREYWYEVIARPPVSGAAKLTVAVVDVVTMLWITVFPGVVKGTAEVAADAVPAPTILRARILTE